MKRGFHLLTTMSYLFYVVYVLLTGHPPDCERLETQVYCTIPGSKSGRLSRISSQGVREILRTLLHTQGQRVRDSPFCQLPGIWNRSQFPQQHNSEMCCLLPTTLSKTCCKKGSGLIYHLIWYFSFSCWRTLNLLLAAPTSCQRENANCFTLLCRVSEAAIHVETKKPL